MDQICEYLSHLHPDILLIIIDYANYSYPDIIQNLCLTCSELRSSVSSIIRYVKQINTEDWKLIKMVNNPRIVYMKMTGDYILGDKIHHMLDHVTGIIDKVIIDVHYPDCVNKVSIDYLLDIDEDFHSADITDYRDYLDYTPYHVRSDLNIRHLVISDSHTSDLNFEHKIGYLDLSRFIVSKISMFNNYIKLSNIDKIHNLHLQKYNHLEILACEKIDNLKISKSKHIYYDVKFRHVKRLIIKDSKIRLGEMDKLTDLSLTRSIIYISPVSGSAGYLRSVKHMKIILSRFPLRINKHTFPSLESLDLKCDYLYVGHDQMDKTVKSLLRLRANYYIDISDDIECNIEAVVRITSDVINTRSKLRCISLDGEVETWNI